MSVERVVRIRDYEYPVEPISRDDRRDMAFDLLDAVHDRRRKLGMSQQRVADLIDINQASVSEGERHTKINRLDVLCGLAYAVGLRVVLVPWDDTSS